MRHSTRSGFILPVTILLGFGIAIVSTTFMQYIVNSSQTLNSQTYASLAREAADSGIAYALSCVQSSTDPTRWTTLTPNSDCNGGGSQDGVPSSYVASDPAGEWQSTFKVATAINGSGGNKKVISIGTVQVMAGAIPIASVSMSRDVSLISTVNTAVPSNGNAVTDLSSDTHSCAIANGRLYCWGDNANGQLGLGDTTDRSSPQLVAASNPGDAFFQKNITRLTVGTGNTCAVADGQLYCWGDNSYGQLGDGTLIGQSSPKLVDDLKNYKITSLSLSQAAYGAKSACAVTNGMVYCWGANTTQQLGQTVSTANTTNSLRPIRVYGYNNGDGGNLSGKKTTAASIGARNACTSTQGTMYCWGALTGSAAAPATAVSMPTAHMPEPLSIKAIGESNCAVLTGQFYCRGKSSALSPSGATNMTIYAGTAPPASQLASGVIGDYDGGEQSSTPSSGNGSYCFWDNKAASSYCASSNASFNNVDGGSSLQSDNQYGRTVTKFGVGDTYKCFVANGAVACWGDEAKGQLGDGNLSGSAPKPQWISWAGGFGTDNSVNGAFPGYATTQISSGLNHSCGVINGLVFCWGSNSNGQIGTNSTDDQGEPTVIQFDPFYIPFTSIVAHYGLSEKIAAGGNHTCAVVAYVETTIFFTPITQVYCWGANGSGQLGTGNTTEQHEPTRISGLPDRITDISAGPTNTCAVADYKLYCWGANGSGQLGDGTTAPSTSPQLVPGFSGMQVTSVSVGTNHICAIANGDGYCWGDNTYKQTGHATQPANASGGLIDTGTAAAVDGNVRAAFTSIAAGNGFTCATINGVVGCWGKNDMGQLGTGATGAPVASPGLLGGGFDKLQADSISAGTNHVCASLQGNIYCWGDGGDGRVGNNLTSGAQPTPFLVNSGAALNLATTAVAAGDATTCSLSNGNILCWGKGLSGQIGNNGFSNSLVPAKIPIYRKLSDTPTYGPLY